MTRYSTLLAAALLAATATYAMPQAAPAPAPAPAPAAGQAPAAAEPKQPRPKSQKEAEALNALFQMQEPDAQMKAIDSFLVNFADTDFKGFMLQFAAMAAQNKGDMVKMVLYSERAIEVDPKNYHAMIILSGAIAQQTKEFDLDKEEKLARAEKNAKAALELLKTAVKPNPNLPDAEWEFAKKDFVGQANSALGIAASARKKYDDAATYYNNAVLATNDPAARVRLAATYNLMSKSDEAIAALAPLATDAQLHPVIKQFADAERKKAEAAKAAKK